MDKAERGVPAPHEVGYDITLFSPAVLMFHDELSVSII